MYAGQLRNTVTFQRPVKVYDDYDQPLPDSWEDVATVWAAIRPTGSNELLVSYQMQSGQTHVVTVRHSDALRTATGAWRVLYGARRFGVLGLPRDRDESHRMLVFDCAEITNG